MLKKEIVNTTANLFSAVDSHIHKISVPISGSDKRQQNIPNAQDIDLNQILQNLSNVDHANESIFVLCELPKETFDLLIQSNQLIVQQIVSYISSNTPNSIIPSLNFIRKCNGIPEFSIFFIHNLINFQQLTDLIFTDMPANIIKALCGLFSDLVSNVGIEAEPYIINFIHLSDQSQIVFLKVSAMRNVLAYLQNCAVFPVSFQNIDIIARFNANIHQTQSIQLMLVSLEMIEHCVDQKKMSHSLIDIIQILKLMQNQSAPIQLWTLKIVYKILLAESLETVNFKAALCKTLHWIFLYGAYASKLQAFLCLRTLIDLFSEPYQPLANLFDEHFFNSIFGLLSNGKEGTVAALSFLLNLIQNSEYAHFARNALLNDDIHEELESLAAQGNEIVSTHAIILLRIWD